MEDNHQIEEIELISTYPINDVLLSQSTSEYSTRSTTAAPLSIATKFVSGGGPGGGPTYSGTRSYTRATSSLVKNPPGCEAAVKVETKEQPENPDNASGDATSTAVQVQQPSDRLIKNACHLCQKQFVYAFALKRHLANHNSQVYSCNQCSKTFKHQSTLLQHKAVHSVNFPYSCDLCQKSFNRISTLKSHRNIHSGIKPFVCDICKKGFHQKGNLKNHYYIHTNERPYRCDICERGFNQMSNLVCHKRNAHRIVQSVFYCQSCDLHFNRIEQLNQHELDTHLRPTKTIYMETDTQMVRVEQVVESQAVDCEKEELQDHEMLPPPPPLTSIKMLEPRREKVMQDGMTTPASSSSGLISSSPLSPNSMASSVLSFSMINDVPMMEETTTTTTHVPTGMTSNNKYAPGGGGGLKNCQMIFEKTENHSFFSKFSVIELPQKIDTLEMRYAEMTNKTPFAMLHFGSDPPCLVEIVQQRGLRTILKPIKKHDLNHLTFSAAGEGEGGNKGAGAGPKIVITIVATIYQSFTKGDFSLFTVKSPEVVRCVKLLVDHDQHHSGSGAQCPSCVVTNCAREDELRELKNKITIAITDYKPTEIKNEMMGE